MIKFFQKACLAREYKALPNGQLSTHYGIHVPTKPKWSVAPFELGTFLTIWVTKSNKKLDTIGIRLFRTVLFYWSRPVKSPFSVNYIPNVKHTHITFSTNGGRSESAKRAIAVLNDKLYLINDYKLNKDI